MSYEFSYEFLSCTEHAKKRMTERGATKSMINSVLLHGKHEVDMDRWDDKKNRWTFVFRDTIDKQDLRVCAAYKNSAITIVTVLNLTNKPATSFPSIAPSFTQKELNMQEESNMSFDDLLQKQTEKRKSIDSSSAKEKQKPVSLPREKSYKQDEQDLPSYDHFRKKNTTHDSFYHPYKDASRKK